MAQSQRQPDDALAARTAAARRVYLDALVAWEQALHAISCELCRPRHTPIEDLERLADQAQTEKERRRVMFRDLSAELGYVPIGEGTALPEENPSCAGERNASTQPRPSAS